MKALIAMSGGVDSSAAAAIMKENGYDCVGTTMSLLGKGGNSRDCLDAQLAAKALGIPHITLDFAEDFGRQVIDRFVEAYVNGLTPNPCIYCNRYIKFGVLLDSAKKLGCDVIATGHYARVERDERSGRWLLKKAENYEKDQSYVLYSLTQEQLGAVRFPLGGYSDKDEVRRYVTGLVPDIARKSESQDICFVADNDYAGFIERRLDRKFPDGNFIGTDGSILGRHRGMIRYTVGQRKGLGLSFPEPMYVCAKSPRDNTVTLSNKDGLYSDRLTAGDFNWVSIEPPKTDIRITVQTRYRAKEAGAYAKTNPDGTVTVIFDEPQRAVSPGQAVVLYDGDIVVGGGTILR